MKQTFFLRAAALALLHVLGCANAGAQPQQLPAPTRFTLTKSAALVEGVLLFKGRPVPDVLLTSCAEYGVVPGGWGKKKHCDQPVEIRTDRAGKFRYQQMSGLPSFTCYNPCAADPASVVWFDAWKDGKPWRMFEINMGFHLSHAYLTCDFGRSKGERMPMPSWPDELLQYAPLALPCKVQRWDP